MTKFPHRPTQGSERVVTSLALCLSYFIILRLMTIPALYFADTHFPGTFFYHLEADERGGPLDGLPFLLGTIELNYIAFVTIFIPAVILRKLPKTLIPLIGVSTVPVSVLILVITS